jgi:hypothetical protein
MFSVWAVLLLVLAISPVTAPFSSCDLEDLLADRDVHCGAILQAKSLIAPAVPGLNSGSGLDLPRVAPARSAIQFTPSAHRAHPRRIPLRI